MSNPMNERIEVEYFIDEKTNEKVKIEWIYSQREDGAEMYSRAQVSVVEE